MSTQSSGFPPTPFSVTAQSFQNVRLLEVPDELLEIITNTQQNIYMKSTPILPAPAPGSSQLPGSGATKEGNLHLCTDDKVWAVKQVSTSNSVYIAKLHARNTASQRDDLDDGGNDEQMDLHDEGTSDEMKKQLEPLDVGLVAYAKPASILELHALSTTTSNYDNEILNLLARMIPTVSSVADIKEVQSSWSLSEIYEHIPAPTLVITRLLSQICAFEVPQSQRQSVKGSTDGELRAQGSGRAYIPSAHLLLSTWTAVMEVATLKDLAIRGVDNENILIEQSNDNANSNNADVMDVDTTAEGENPEVKVHRAISKTLFKQNGHFTTLGIQDKSTGKLNERECTRWVGNLILADIESGTLSPGVPRPVLAVTAANGKSSGFLLSTTDFEKKWEDSVPTDWMKFCSVDVLRPACRVLESEGDGDGGGGGQSEVVGWQPFVLEDEEKNADGSGGRSGNAGAGAAAVTATGGSKAGKNKRKWHEKFASQRNAVKK